MSLLKMIFNERLPKLYSAGIMHRCKTKHFNIFLFVLLILFSGIIFFINRHHTHDWGDDFALYLMQAENFVSFKFQTPTYYVFNPLNPILAPAHYPPIFPVFLSLFLPFFKTEISAYIFLIHLLMISNVIVFWHYLKKYYSVFYVFPLCLLWLYNPWVLGFKNEVMSEFLFVFLLLLFFNNFSKKRSIYMPIILGSLMVATRSIGIAIIPTLLMLSFFNKRWKYNSFTALGIVVLTLFFNLIFFGSIFDSTYSYNFQSENFWLIVVSNIAFYFKHLHNIFIPSLETKYYLIYFTQFSTVGLIVLGIYSVFKEKKHLPEIIFLMFYFSIIVSYPYQAAGYRFLFPVFPLLLLIIAQSMEEINRRIKFQSIKGLTVIIPFFFLIQYYPNINYIINNQREPDGPYSKSAQEAWLAVKQNTNKNDTVYYNHPKALGYMTSRHSCVYPSIQPGQMKYFLDDLKNRSQYVYHLVKGGEYCIIWENERFALYSRIE
jgi:hypothetical protein